MDERVLEIVLRARDEASKVIEGAADKLKRSFGDAEKASKAFGIGLLGAGTAAAGFIGYGAKIAGDLESSRQGFVTLLGSAKKADTAIAQIKRDAANTPFELPGLISANQLLTSVTKDADGSEKLLLNVGKALAAMGKGQPELDRIIVNLQQIGAVGHASLTDIKQFAFNGIPIFDMLTQATGKSGEALNDLISSGGVTFGMLTQMFNEAGGAGGRFADAYKNQAGTFNQLTSNMRESFNIFLSDLAKNTGVFDVLKQAMSGLINFMNEHGKDIGTGITQVITFLKDNGPIVAGVIIGGLTPAMIAFTGSVVAATLALAPYLIAGAALGLLAKFIMDNWKPISQFFLNIGKTVSAVVGGVISDIKNMVNSIIDHINGLIHGVNKVGSKVGLGSVKIPDIPKFEQGGYVPQTGIAQLHEGEFVLSRDMLAGRQNVPSQVRNTTNNNMPINIYATVNETMDLNLLGNKLAFAVRNSR